MNLKRPRSLALLLSLASAALTLGACGTAPTEAEDDPAQSAAVDGFTVIDDDPVDYEACERISEDVQSLLASTMSCARDANCDTLVADEMLADACLPSISCYVAVADPVELEPIREELRMLDDEYRRRCGLCPVVQCVDDERIYAQCEDGRCDVAALHSGVGHPGVGTAEAAGSGS